MGKRQEKNQPESKRKETFFREIQIEFLLHELKDPVSIINAGTRMLLDKREKYGPLTPRQEKTLNRVLRNTIKTQEMLRDLLEVGRSESGNFVCGRFRPASVTIDVIMEVLEAKSNQTYELARSYQQKDEVLKFLANNGVLIDIAPQVAPTEMLQDEIKFRQIVANLIRNALHYRKDRVEINLKKDNDRLLLEVIDDGPGIDPEHHQLIFQRYTQVNSCSVLSRQSHGLGLAGALILARCLGGDIEINSEKGKGATFRLILPITLSEVSKTE